MQSFILSERDKLNMFHCVKNLLQGLPLDVKTIGRTFLDDSQSQVCVLFSFLPVLVAPITLAVVALPGAHLPPPRHASRFACGFSPRRCFHPQRAVISFFPVLAALVTFTVACRRHVTHRTVPVASVRVAASIRSVL